MSDEEQNYKPRLDTLEGCAQELATCNREIAELAPGWSRDAGQLKALEQNYKRMFKEAMRATRGSNADERTATAHAAVEEAFRDANDLGENEPGLSDRIEELIGNVESSKVSFATLERRSSNVQSVLQLRRQEAGLGRFVAN